MISVREQRTALYRFYDAHENLLYVGISNDPWRRWREHVYEKSWYPQVKHQSVTWYDTEDQARATETRAIRRERPRFNIAGAIRPPEARVNVSIDVIARACGTWFCIPLLLGAAVFVLAMNTPGRSPAGTAAHVLAWMLAAVTLSLPVPLFVTLTVAFTPLIYRFGCWLDRNFGNEVREASATAAAEEDARHIPPVVWALAPGQTYRIGRRMRAGSPCGYQQALDEEMDRQIAALERARDEERHERMVRVK